MNLELVSTIGIPLIAAIGWLIRKTILERLSVIEDQMHDKASYSSVYKIMDDKLIATKEDILELKSKVEQLNYFLLFNSKEHEQMKENLQKAPNQGRNPHKQRREEKPKRKV